MFCRSLSVQNVFLSFWLQLFWQGENFLSPSLLPIHFLFCFLLCHTFVFSCTSVGVSSRSSKKSLNVHTYMHSHWLTFSPTSSAVALKKHSGSTSRTITHVAGLLYCSLFGLKNLLAAGHSGVKKKKLVVWHFPAASQENIKCLWIRSKPVDV